MVKRHEGTKKTKTLNPTLKPETLNPKPPSEILSGPAACLRASGPSYALVAPGTARRSWGLASNVISTWQFPKIRVPYFGVLIIRILLFRVLY